MRSFRSSACALAVVVAVCTTVGAASARDDADPLVETTGTLIDQPGQSLQLCVGPIELSLPPRCSGLPVKGADLDVMPRTVGVESYGGTRWVDGAVFRGRLHGRTLRLTKVSPIRPTATPSPIGSHFSLPDAACPPDGKPGVQPWEAAAFLDETAARYPDTYAGGWIDPQGRVTARFTDAPGAYEEDLRSRFFASLCVGRAPHTLAALKSLQTQLTTELLPVLEKHDRRFTSGAVNEPQNDVDVGIDLPAPRAMREELRRRFGDALHLISSMRVVG